MMPLGCRLRLLASPMARLAVRHLSTSTRPPLHIVGANGYPAVMYTPFLDHFQTHYQVRASDIYDSDTSSWGAMASVLIAAAQSSVHQHGMPVTAIGHSLGGALTKIAATQRPDLFDKVILIDPPMFDLATRKAIAAAQRLGEEEVHKIIQPAQFARTRRGSFASLEDARQYYKGMKLYASLDPRCMELLISHGLVMVGEKYELVFPIEAEVSIFHSTPADIDPPLVGQYAPITTKGAYLYSAQHAFTSASDIASSQELLHPFPFIPFPHTHFYPLQKPKEAAEFISDLLSRM